MPSRHAHAVGFESESVRDERESAVAERATWRWFVDNRHRTDWDRPLAMVALGNYLRLVRSFGGYL
jgi:hypothetical protein